MTKNLERREETEPAPVEDTDDVEIVSIDAVDDHGRVLPARPEANLADGDDDFFEIELADDAAAAAGAAVGEGEADQLRESLLRSRADLENFRARVERDRDLVQARARAEVIAELLPILDDLDLALGAPADGSALHEGVELIARDLLDRLARFGLQSVEAEGLPFDPEVHEAAETEARADLPPQTVIGELRRGYRLGDELLRASLVRVSVAPGEEDGS